MQPWLNQKAGAKYAAVSLKIFREWLNDGLDHVRIRGRIVRVRPEAIDAYMLQFRASENDISKVLEGLLK